MRRQTDGSKGKRRATYGGGGTPGIPAYAASKKGVVGLTKAAALEYAQEGIRVNAVCPSHIRTPLVERITASNPGLEGEYIASIPIGRMGTSEEVAEMVGWLCSDAASFVTGQAIAVDGGYLAR